MLGQSTFADSKFIKQDPSEVVKRTTDIELES
jgi:hypothetical protein